MKLFKAIIEHTIYRLFYTKTKQRAKPQKFLPPEKRIQNWTKSHTLCSIIIIIIRRASKFPHFPNIPYRHIVCVAKRKLFRDNRLPRATKYLDFAASFLIMHILANSMLWAKNMFLESYWNLCAFSASFMILKWSG